MPRRHLTAAVALALLTACAHRPAAALAARPGGEGPSRCSMAVAGTGLALADAPGGEQLTFTTGGEVALLQARVQAMAERHNLRYLARRGRQVALPGDGARARTRWQGTAVPPSYATVVEVPGGAILGVTATAPDDVQQLRYAYRVRGWWLQHRGCAPTRPPRGT